jgi:hypothetical protein
VGRAPTTGSGESEWSYLLPQPNGFEALEMCTTLASPRMNAEHGDDALASLDVLLRVPTPALPTALPVGLPTHQPLQPLVPIGVRYAMVEGDHIGVERREGRFRVARANTS